jgi:hypothetical protein
MHCPAHRSIFFPFSPFTFDFNVGFLVSPSDEETELAMFSM